MPAAANLEESQPILVLTALEETWGTTHPLLFLGEWCKRYERRDVWGKRTYKTVTFHWDDRRKLLQDYNYLESLHTTLLRILSQSLNRLHGVNYDDRYWQILLDPWLTSYLGVMFDRWECLRSAFSEKDSFSSRAFVPVKDNFHAPYSFADFVQAAAYSDKWNQCIYQRILRSQYANQLTPLAGPDDTHEVIAHSSAHFPQRANSIRKIWARCSQLCNAINSSPNIVFLGATFSTVALVKLNLALGQLPYRDPFQEDCYDTNDSVLSGEAPVRKDVELDWQARSDFEQFIKFSIPSDLPKCIVENFSTLRQRARNIVIRPKVIITGSSHWDNAFAKAWIAEKSASKTKFVVLEHGGSLPPHKELFDFESSISDVRISWFRPYHEKHLQLPPPRFVERYEGRFRLRRLLHREKYCSLIGNECALWAYRAHFYPMAHQWVDSFTMVLELFDRLNPDIKNLFRIKPYPASQGWHTAQRFADALGASFLHQERSLERVYAMSKVIVCSYPETTFSEAMASGVPTVLVYPEHLYELNAVAYPLLDILKGAKIVFNNSVEAANHLNAIWENPVEWWGSPETLYARQEFNQQALRLGPGWLKEWKAFLAPLITNESKASY